MKRHLFTLAVAMLPVILLTSSTGCMLPKDITHTPEGQAMGLVGKGFVLERDTAVFQLGRPFRRLIIYRPPEQSREGGPGKQIADLPAGTRLEVVKIVHAPIYDDGLFQMWQNVVLARVEAGPLAGKLIDLGLGGLQRSDRDLWTTE